MSFERTPGLWDRRLDGDRRPNHSSGRQRVPPRSPTLPGRPLLVAYMSNETNPREIFVEPVPPTGARYMVSRTGGASPVWSPLTAGSSFYRTSSSGFTTTVDAMVSVDVRTDPSFAWSEVQCRCPSGLFPGTSHDLLPGRPAVLMLLPPSGNDVRHDRAAADRRSAELVYRAEAKSVGRRLRR
jgi:hypothetical protein